MNDARDNKKVLNIFKILAQLIHGKAFTQPFFRVILNNCLSDALTRERCFRLTEGFYCTG